MSIDEEIQENAQRRTALVDQLEQLIRNTVSEENDVRDQLAVLAQLLTRFGHDSRDFSSFTFEAMLKYHVGAAIGRETQGLLALADKLHAKKCSQENEYDFNHADRYAFSLKNTEKCKVFAMRTQNVNYLVLLTKGWRGWDIHLRQWWDVLSADGYVSYVFEPFIKGELMSLEQAQKLVKPLSDYADDLPGVSFPDRLRLQAFLDTDFAIEKDSSCRGLRYGDARDIGYLASVKVSPFELHVADGMTWYSLSQLHYVWYDLLSAMDIVGNDEDEPD